jgi:hypothetical protein
MAAQQPNVEEIYAGTAMLSGWKKNRGGSVHGSLPFKLPDPPMKCNDPEQPTEPFQRLSHHRSSPAFGFGSPAHGWGKYKVPNQRSRSTYLDGRDETPMPGAHEVTPHQREKGDFSLCYNSDRFRYTAPDYSFGVSETERFPQKRYSEKSHALAWPYGSSHLDDPPPTHKPNIDLTKRHPPIVNVTQKRAHREGGFWFRNSPGADAYKGENRHKILNYKEAIWKFGTEPKGNPRLSCLINKVSTGAKVGPGSYTHATSLIRNEHGKQW